MVELQHGDLLEQRRGGVDVLRVVVGTLALHEQSGAVRIHAVEGDVQREGWLLVRLGQPVMAFHHGEHDFQGLEALLAIEEDGLLVDNRVELYEFSMNALRHAMTTYPDGVLHLEHQPAEGGEGHWWSSVRLPATSWRRADRLEDIEAIALASEQRLRTTSSAPSASALHPGSVYIHDSPDPHALIQLAVELAERGMPMLGLFGLPHAETDQTKRLPSPQCYALLSPHGGYDLLPDRASVMATVNAFLWGNERSLILINGLDRLGNAFGDDGTVDLFRSVCDGARYNDHTVLCSTDLELFELKTRHALLSEATTLTTSTLQGWLSDPDVLWDHPVLMAPDEEEEQWLAAQIQHQGAKLGVGSPHFDAFVEGGSTEVDEGSRAEATAALTDIVADWEETTPVVEGAASSVPTTAVGATSWRPSVDDSIPEARFVSQSPRFRPDEEEAPVDPPRRLRQRPESVVRPPPQIRQPQRMVRRKKSPSLPAVSLGEAQRTSKALASSPPNLPEWPSSRRPHDAYRKENMALHEQRQTEALERQQGMKPSSQARALRDNVASSPEVNTHALPPPNVPQTVQLPSSGSTVPLPSGLHPVNDDASLPARESTRLDQHTVDIEAIYRKWTTFEEQDGLDATALYNEKGEVLKRYKGGSS